MKANRKSARVNTPITTRNAKRIARKGKGAAAKPVSNVVTLDTNKGKRARLIQANKARLTAEADAILKKAAADKKAAEVLTPREPMSEKELQALETLYADVIDANTQKEEVLVTAADIRMIGNQPESPMSLVNRWGITNVRTNNICVTMAQYKPYQEPLLALGTDPKAHVKYYMESPEGQELEALLLDAKNESQKTDGLLRRKNYMIEHIGKAAMIVKQQAEAKANGFRLSFGEYSIQVRIYHLMNMDLTMLFSIENLAKLSFAGKRDMKGFAELSIDKRPRRTAEQIKLDKATAEAKKKTEADKKNPGANTDGTQGKSPDKSAPVITSISALPDILAQFDRMLTDDRADKMSTEERVSDGVHLVPLISKIFRPIHVRKSKELRAYASDIIMTLTGILNTVDMVLIKSYATRENDAPVDTKPVVNKKK